MGKSKIEKTIDAIMWAFLLAFAALIVFQLARVIL